MKYKMIKQTVQLTNESIKVILGYEHEILSTTRGDNKSYGIPLSYTVFNDEIISFHCKTSGYKLESVIAFVKKS